MQLNIETLSKMLRPVDFNAHSKDHDTGWNNAIIAIMGILRDPDLKAQARFLLPRSLSNEQVSQIIINISNDQPIQAIKDVKAWTGLDLKSSKEIIDNFREKFGEVNIKTLTKDLTEQSFIEIKL